MSDVDWSALTDEFEHAEIGWVPIAGNSKNTPTRLLVAAFVDARAIQRRLDDVLTPAGWKTDYQPGPEGGVLCHLSIKVDGEWITKADGAENTDIEAVKGGLSNAFKRAASAWGIGRYLHRVPPVWVPCDERKKFEPPNMPSHAGRNAPNVKSEPAAPAITRDSEFRRLVDVVIEAGWLPATAEGYRDIIERISKCSFDDIPAVQVKKWADKIVELWAKDQNECRKAITKSLGEPDGREQNAA